MSRGKANGRDVRRGPYGGIYYEVPESRNKIYLSKNQRKMCVHYFEKMDTS